MEIERSTAIRAARDLLQPKAMAWLRSPLTGLHARHDGASLYCYLHVSLPYQWRLHHRRARIFVIHLAALTQELYQRRFGRTEIILTLGRERLESDVYFLDAKKLRLSSLRNAIELLRV